MHGWYPPAVSVSGPRLGSVALWVWGLFDSQYGAVGNGCRQADFAGGIGPTDRSRSRADRRMGDEPVRAAGAVRLTVVSTRLTQMMACDDLPTTKGNRLLFPLGVGRVDKLGLVKK